MAVKTAEQLRGSFHSRHENNPNPPYAPYLTSPRSRTLVPVPSGVLSTSKPAVAEEIHPTPAWGKHPIVSTENLCLFYPIVNAKDSLITERQPSPVKNLAAAFRN